MCTNVGIAKCRDKTRDKTRNQAKDRLLHREQEQVQEKIDYMGDRDLCVTAEPNDDLALLHA